jgi:hypothetical protein
MPDYNNGKIYTIRCRDNDSLIYVGSTIQPLYKRWDAHKRFHSNDKFHDYNMKVYVKMREIGIESFYIELYETFPCNSKEELNRREGEIIREIGTLNTKIAGRTRSEYREENKEKIALTTKEYDIKYREQNAEKIKQYYQDNKAKILEQQKEYYKNNEDKLNERKKINNNKYKTRRNEINIEVVCSCGCKLQKYALYRHLKSKKHLAFEIQEKNEEK